MDRDYALRLLCLSDTFTAKDVRDAHRRKSKEAHPDATGGDSGDQADLNAARSLLLNELDAHRQLIVLQKQLPALERTVSVMVCQEQAKAIKQDILHKRCSRLLELKKISGVIGLASAAVVAFSQLTTFPAYKLAFDGAWRDALIAMTMAMGLSWAAVKYVIDTITTRTEIYAEALSSTHFCAEQLKRLSRMCGDSDIIDTSRVDMNYRPMLSSRLRHYGLNLTILEKAPLILKKAQEHGLVTKLKYDGTPSEKYKILPVVNE